MNVPTILPEQDHQDHQEQGELVSSELYHIIRAIGKERTWESIFGKHCKRTGRSLLNYNDLDIKTYHNGYVKIAAQWQGIRYNANGWSESEARKNLYEMLIRSVINSEMY